MSEKAATKEENDIPASMSMKLKYFFSHEFVKRRRSQWMKKKRENMNITSRWTDNGKYTSRARKHFSLHSFSFVRSYLNIKCAIELLSPSSTFVSALRYTHAPIHEPKVLAAITQSTSNLSINKLYVETEWRWKIAVEATSFHPLDGLKNRNFHRWLKRLKWIFPLSSRDTVDYLTYFLHSFQFEKRFQQMWNSLTRKDYLLVMARLECNFLSFVFFLSFFIIIVIFRLQQICIYHFHCTFDKAERNWNGTLTIVDDILPHFSKSLLLWKNAKRIESKISDKRNIKPRQVEKKNVTWKWISVNRSFSYSIVLSLALVILNVFKWHTEMKSTHVCRSATLCFQFVCVFTSKSKSEEGECDRGNEKWVTTQNIFSHKSHVFEMIAEGNFCGWQDKQMLFTIRHR